MIGIIRKSLFGIKKASHELLQFARIKFETMQLTSVSIYFLGILKEHVFIVCQQRSEPSVLFSHMFDTCLILKGFARCRQSLKLDCNKTYERMGAFLALNHMILGTS